MNPQDYWMVPLSAAITGFFGYMAALIQHRRKPAEESDQIASAFGKLVKDLQAENARHLASIKTLREDAHRMNNQLTKLQAFAHALFRHIGLLERQIISLGAEPAVRPVLPDPE